MAVTMVLVGGVVGCGGDDDPADGAGAGGGAVETAGGDGGGTDRSDGSAGGGAPGGGGEQEQEQVRDAVVAIQEAFAAGRPQAVCAMLTAAAARDAASSSRERGGPGTCADTFSELTANYVKGTPVPQITAVELNGDRGNVKLKDGKYRHEVGVRKEDGAWKVNYGLGGTPAQVGGGGPPTTGS